MIIREDSIQIGENDCSFALEIDGCKDLYKKALFFDLEHYVYKKPICIGVFGCGYYDDDKKRLNVTQYMIQNKEDSLSILLMAEKYFKRMIEEHEKEYIVTFSGNNDFTVINYLFKKYNILFDIGTHFKSIDLQKCYEKKKGSSIGLKALEKEFNIVRDSELISGSNLAKTFSKMLKDRNYIDRMPRCKSEKILLYNEQDVVSLFHIYLNWERVL